MYFITIKDRFFCGGKSFDQLLGVFHFFPEANEFLDNFLNKHPEFNHHLIEILRKPAGVK